MLVTLQSDITVCHSGLIIYHVIPASSWNLSKENAFSFYERPRSP